MYVCSGALKGRKLLLPKSSIISSLRCPLKPTTDFTKKVLCNMIQHDSGNLLLYPIQDAVVADACCGTGAVGFELISLGAKKCYFFDQSGLLLNNVMRNAEHLNQEDKVRIIATDVARAKTIPEKLHLLFIDPPYNSPWIIKNYLKRIGHPSMLYDHATIITETKIDANVKVPDQFKLLHVRQVNSQVALSFYRFYSDTIIQS